MAKTSKAILDQVAQIIPRRILLREATKGTEEQPDDTAVELPGKTQHPLTLQQEIARFVRIEVSKKADENSQETFEEADDFEISEDDDITSPYTVSELRDDEETYQPDGEVRNISGSSAEASPEPTEQYYDKHGNVVQGVQRIPDAEPDPAPKRRAGDMDKEPS